MGGNAIQFLTNTLIKLTPSSKLHEDKKYKIKGYQIKVELIKSRTAPAGSVTTMIFNQSEGFDDDLSLYDYLNSNGAISGSPVSYKVAGMANVGFKLASLKQTLHDNEAFRNQYHSVAEALLTENLRESSKLHVIEEVKEEVVEENDTA